MKVARFLSPFFGLLMKAVRMQPIQGPPDGNGCSGTEGDGYAWCPETSECILGWITACPVAGGTTILGPAQINCTSNARCNLDGDCSLTAGESGSSWTMRGVYMDNLEGLYNIITSNCTATCINCFSTEIVPGENEDGCEAIGLGFIWCPTTSECIEPFVTECPIAGDTTLIEGPAQMNCTNATCTLDGTCDLTAGENGGDTVIRDVYLDQLNGIFNILSSNCNATCMGCTATDVERIPGISENGCLEPLGYTWCPAISECIRPAETFCPLAGGTSFNGPTQMDCKDGICSLDGYCELTSGVNGSDSTVAITSVDGGYQDQLDGIYNILPSNCSASCLNCSATEATTTPGVDENGCAVPLGHVWCPEISECIAPLEAECPIAGGTLVNGYAEMSCTDGRCGVNGNNCELLVAETSSNTYKMGFLYVDALNGMYNISCATCIGCTVTGGSATEQETATESPVTSPSGPVDPGPTETNTSRPPETDAPRSEDRSTSGSEEGNLGPDSSAAAPCSPVYLLAVPAIVAASTW